MIKCLIIDDERLARTELNRILATYKDIEVLDQCSNASEAITKIEELKPDLIFLDIQMPGKNGFELLQEIIYTPEVIFVSAYDDFAIKAFDVNALDYILKPIDESRLSASLAKVIKKIQQKQDTEDPSEDQLQPKDQVFVKDGDKCWFVAIGDIRLFESEGNYVRLYFENNKPLILKSLNNLDRKLSDKHFFRANRKHIINLECIDKIETWFSGGLLVILNDGRKIEISRRQAVKLKDKMSL